jgi:hypothetical protein
VKDSFSWCRTEIDYVPWGYASGLQVIDLGMIKPFKHYVRSKIDDWKVEHDNKNRNNKIFPGELQMPGITSSMIFVWVLGGGQWIFKYYSSSTRDDVLLDESNHNNSQNTQQSDILVGDPLLFDKWDCSFSADDDDNSNELVLETDN